MMRRIGAFIGLFILTSLIFGNRNSPGNPGNTQSSRIIPAMIVHQFMWAIITDRVLDIWFSNENSKEIIQPPKGSGFPKINKSDLEENDYQKVTEENVKNFDFSLRLSCYQDESDKACLKRHLNNQEMDKIVTQMHDQIQTHNDSVDKMLDDYVQKFNMAYYQCHGYINKNPDVDLGNHHQVLRVTVGCLLYKGFEDYLNVLAEDSNHLREVIREAKNYQK